MIALGGDHGFGFAQTRFRRFRAAVEIVAGHHNRELGVFGFRGFAFGVGDFMEQRFVRFVGFYRRGLLAVFLRAVFPLADVEFELFAFFGVVGMRFFRGGNLGSRAGKSRVCFLNALGQRFEIGAERGNLLVDGLYVDQVGYGGVHEPVILAHAPAASAAAEVCKTKALRVARRAFASDALRRVARS